MENHKVVMRMSRRDKFGQRYTCHLGEELLCDVTHPEPVTIRILKARGLTGSVEFWDDVRPYPRSTWPLAGKGSIYNGGSDKTGLEPRPELSPAVAQTFAAYNKARQNG